MVRDKTFREDLYYRLNVVRIRMPALRERGEDIPQIVDFCLQHLARQRKTRVSKVSPEALALLLRHGWPGNVRELENTIYRSAVVAQGDAILVKDLPAELGGGHSSAPFAFPTAAPVAAPEPAPTPPPPAPPAPSPATAPAPRSLAELLDEVFARLSATGEPVMPLIEREMTARARQAGQDLADAAPAPRPAKTGAKRGKARP
jgi:two-component system nitrogen regulation response regulator GlnG